MDKFLVDTSVIIEFLRGYSKGIQILDSFREKGILMISVITSAELYFGCRNEWEEKELELLLDTFIEIPLKRQILSMANKLNKEYGKRYNCDLIDMLIAATAIVEKAKLVTLNLKHFNMIEEIEVYNASK